MKPQRTPDKNASLDLPQGLPALETQLLKLLETDLHLKTFPVESLIEQIVLRDPEPHEVAAFAGASN